MMEALFAELQAAESDDGVAAAIITGTDPYYCAGVELSAVLKPMHPRKLHELIRKHNQQVRLGDGEGRECASSTTQRTPCLFACSQVFDAFLDFEKPLFAAVNGPAIGASVTSSTLTDQVREEGGGGEWGSEHF